MKSVKPTKREFIQKAKKGNLIPVYKEVPADLETPVSAFLKIARRDYAFLLESVEGSENIARYSFLGSRPSLIFKSKGRDIELIQDGRRRRYSSADPLTEIKRLMQKYRFVAVKGLPRFCGGLVGYMGYEVVNFFERLNQANLDDLGLNDCLFMLTDTILIFDHTLHRLKIINNVHLKDGENPARAYRMALRRIEEICAELKRPLSKRPRPKKSGGGTVKIKSNLSRDKFTQIVKKAKGYIKEGEIIQAVLSQRFELECRSSALDIYRALRSINPSPYMFCLQMKDFHLVGSSPELFVRCEEGNVEIRPIAGTRPRGGNEHEDANLSASLLADPKERAEHIMLVDLGRNDIGRVCRSGSVKVSELMVIEKYSHVMHIVSEVKGRLRRDKDIYELIRACFPAGTVSGAPKIRAMQIINELENTQRGPYAGLVGYFSFSGNLDSCITIRTILIKGRTAYIQAGAGIVADSVPAKEFKETQNKARAMIRAIETAENGQAQ